MRLRAKCDFGNWTSVIAIGIGGCRELLDAGKTLSIAEDERLLRPPDPSVGVPTSVGNNHSVGATHCAVNKVAVLTILLATFLGLQLWLPLRTSVRIGADEGFETAKAVLILKGYQLYTEIWNDQPPLHTFLVAKAAELFPGNLLAPRLLTVGFAAILLASFFLMACRVSGLLVAGLATAWLIASPGFLELSCSVMQEIPALAPAITSLCLLVIVRDSPWRVREISAGVALGIALQFKFIEAVYLPIAALILWLRSGESWRRFFSGWLSYTFGASASFLAVNCLVGGGAFLVQIGQSWSAHFASATSFEYGSPADHPFDWDVLLRNWDATIPATVGLILGLRQVRGRTIAFLPAAWLMLMLAVFSTHKPWWTYYIVHLSIPLSWCAGIGVARLIDFSRNRRGLAVPFAAIAVLVVAWMGARLYLQISGIRKSPQTYSSLVLDEIARFKSFTTFLYADEPVYSFHTGIPLPPRLGVISLKRFWSGDLTTARLAEELERVKPGLMLLSSTTHELPYQRLLQSEYRLVYQDSSRRLYAHTSVLKRSSEAGGGL